MADMIAGPGQGLPYPQALYPSWLFTAPFTAPTNRFTLGAGNSLLIPAGTWIVQGGVDSAIQWKDPVNGAWNNLNPVGTAFGRTIRSDGFNFRIANLSGSVTGATVTAPGTGYVQGTTAVVPSAGNSVWQAIVGGALGAVTITAPGANYTLPPLVFVAAPPYPGIPATGHAVIGAGGAVTGIVWDSPGAGYTYPPQIVIVPDPNEPSLQAGYQGAGIQQAAATTVLGGGGTVTGVLLVSAGVPQATAPTLTITGQGTGATATVLPATAVPAASDQITLQPASGP
jgi:hypothetical protein